MTLSRFAIYILGVLSLLSVACTAERGELPEPVNPAKGPGVTLRLTTGEMLPQIVASRADDALEQKTAEEKKINTVHLFFFDADGQFLTATDDDNFAPYRHYDFTDGRQPYINIPEDVFADQENLEGVQVYAAVNIEGTTFRTRWTPDGDIVAGHPDDEDAEVEIGSLADLLAWVYRPTVREDVSKLPEGGMPMVGRLTSDVSLAGTKDLDLKLTALMARVDANVELNGSQENHDDLLPRMTVTEYGVLNLPVSVAFFPTDLSYRTECATVAESTVKVAEPKEIYDGESVTFSYYTYENLRDADKEGFSYPDGVDPTDTDVTQRWKPRLAPEGASALVIRGDYWTHQELFYQAQFLFYLGDNTTDNFEVYRNRRYINNVTISGLEYVRNSDENVFTFDARVNVKTDNPVFISIVNERRLDAHWCVLPMDVYFLESAPEGALCEVEISDEAKGWISLDYCDASMVAESDIKAGWGCRDFFTENMIEEVGTKSAVARNNRDRIYFYIDENASEYGRTAIINLTYKRSKDDPNPIARTIELEQAGLLPFIYNGTTYYMESYEEYAEHYDPLDPHTPSPWYQPSGIPWAAEGSGLENKALSDGTLSVLGAFGRDMTWSPFDVIHSGDGLSLSQYLMGYSTYSGYNVSKKDIIGIYPSSDPQFAVSVACSKNKISTGDNQTVKWFLPSVGQCEEMMKQLVSNHQYFTRFFYWTSNTARNPNRTMSGSVKGRENPYRARAVRINSDGTIIASEVNHGIWDYPPSTSDSTVASDYTSGDYSSISYENGGGRTLRTQPLRVRAIRVADGVEKAN